MPDENSEDARITQFLEAAICGNQTDALKLFDRMSANSRQSFLVAAMMGDAMTVERELQLDPSIATRKFESRNWEPIIYVAFSRFHETSEERAGGIIRVVRALLANGADPNTKFLYQNDPNKLPILWAASCEAHHPALVRVLLEAGATPNDGESIYHAAERNYRDILELLLEFGANISGPLTPWNNTPLYFILGNKPPSAMSVLSLAGAEWLLEHGADPNAPSYEKELRPVHLGAANGWGPELFELLLKHQADIHIRTKNGRNAFALALRYGNTAAADWLRAAGVDTALIPIDEFFAACVRGEENAVKLFLAGHPDFVKFLPESELRLIVNAAGEGNVQAVRLMLLAGVPVGTREKAGQTALHNAAWFGCDSVVELLLTHDAPLEIADNQYAATPLGWACHGSIHCPARGGNHARVVELLLSAGAALKPGWAGNSEVNQILQKRGGDASNTNPQSTA